MIRPFRRLPVLPATVLALVLLVPSPARPAPTGTGFPALATLVVDGDSVQVRTGVDQAGTIRAYDYDAGRNAWSPARPIPDATAAAPRLDQVIVFDGGLFDQFRDSTTLDLGDGYVLARRDTGFALVDHGEDRGWPMVTEGDVDEWGGEVRLGLPREDPEGQLRTLFATGRLRNVPGPFARTAGTLWFGLAGGFTGGEGQLGGLVAYDVATRSFRVVRHKFIVDAAVTRLLGAGDELWIGTGRFGPLHLEGLRGMLLYRPKRREWRQFAPENSRISGDLVYDAALAGRQLWVTTDRGVSRYDTQRHLWTSWYWHADPDGANPVLRGDLPDDPAAELLK